MSKPLTVGAQGAQWQFSNVQAQAYETSLDLDPRKAAELLNDPVSPQDYYILSLAECIELLIQESTEKFDLYEDRFQKRRSLGFEKYPRNDRLFLMAEMHLQWSFVYLKFGHEMDAALNLREAYLIATELQRESPDYMAIKKTTGLLNVIIGSMPEKYHWILGLLGMQGSVAEGLKSLDETSDFAPIAFESSILRSFVDGFVLQQPEPGFARVNDLLRLNPQNHLALFVGAALAIKSSQSEKALALLRSFDSSPPQLIIPYTKYLAGEVYLHKAVYDQAIESYKSFIDLYDGINYLKDAHYKIGLCYWLAGDTDNAEKFFRVASTTGRENAEADRAAARSLREKRPDVSLAKARFFTDGGYYADAEQLLNDLAEKKLSGEQQQTEYFYRKARLFHKTNRLEAAKLFYSQTIDMSGQHQWYYAPNSCLQLGYIYLDEKNYPDAVKNFERALSYKNHEYKNSIDSKAKSALSRLRKQQKDSERKKKI